MCGLAIAVCCRYSSTRAASADELCFQLDGHTRAVRLVDPFDAMLLDVARHPFDAGRDVDTLAATVHDLGLVFLRVDLDLVVMCGLLHRNLGDDLYWLAGGLHAVHSSRANADALLPTALAEAVELRPVEQFAEDSAGFVS